MTTETPEPQGFRVNAKVAQHNDMFRHLACCGTDPGIELNGRLLVTPSVISAGDGFVREAIGAVGAFDIFEPGNDPDGLHDFGAVEVRGQQVLWKLDLYQAGSNFGYGAETPDNPETTIRVLTIMLARDW